MSSQWDACPTCKGSGYVLKYDPDVFDFHLRDAMWRDPAPQAIGDICHCDGPAHPYDPSWCER